MPGEIYVQIVVDYGDDPKVRALARYGKAARGCRDLYVQMICYCRKMLSDGSVPAEQIGVLVYPDPPKVGLQDVARLVAVGLVEEHAGGYHLPGYLKRNPSRAEVEANVAAKAAGAVAANHRRWHVDRNRYDPSCDLCTDSDASRLGVSPLIDPLTPSANPRESTETKTETETETTSPSSRGRRASAPANSRPRPGRQQSSGDVGKIVAAWVDAAQAVQGDRPSASLVARVGKQVKTLLGEGKDPARLEAAARSAGAHGWDDLGRELLRIAANGQRPDQIEKTSGWDV